MNFQFNNLTFTTCNSSRITQQFQQSNFSVYLKKLKKTLYLRRKNFANFGRNKEKTTNLISKSQFSFIIAHFIQWFRWN